MTNDEIHQLFNLQSPPPLFIYTITPEEVETGRGASNPLTLLVGVYNPKGNGFVKCDYIQLGLVIGDGARDLTTNPNDVKAVANQTNWVIQKQPYTQSPLLFKITPAQTSPPTTGLAAGESISFKLTGIQTNSVEGSTPIYVAEKSKQAQPFVAEIPINKSSPNLKILYFQAVPPVLAPGQKATLSWETTGASRCTVVPLDNSICPDAPPPNPLPTSGQMQVCPLESLVIYTLTAYSHSGGFKTFPAPVTVSAVQIKSFTANPSTVDSFAPTSKLQWQVLNAKSLTLDPGGIDVTGKTSIDVNPPNATGYTLTARGDVGIDTKVANVYVTPPDVSQFSSSPAAFVRGQPVSLSWKTSHANSCSIDQGVGAVQPPGEGTVAVRQQQQTTYTLTASGLGQPATKQLTLTPQPNGWNSGGSVQAFPPYLVGLTYKDQLWLFDTYAGRVFSSADGVAWKQVATSWPISSRANSAALVFNDGGGEKMWIMGGLWAKDDRDRGLYNDVWSSADGINWTQVKTTSIWSPRAWHRAVVFKGKMWVMGGGISVGAPPYWGNDVWSSADGVNWTQATASAQWSPRMEFGAAVFNPASTPAINQIWICGGSDMNSNALAEAWYTEDGATWTKAAAPWSARDRCNLLTLNDKLYLLGGVGDMTVLTEMWTMDARMQWSQLPDRMPYDQASLGYWGIVTGVFNWRVWLVFYARNAPIYFYNP